MWSWSKIKLHKNLEIEWERKYKWFNRFVIDVIIHFKSIQSLNTSNRYKGKLLFTILRRAKWQSWWKPVCRFLKKLNIDLQQDLAISVLYVCSKDLDICCNYRVTCSYMFICCFIHSHQKIGNSLDSHQLMNW